VETCNDLDDNCDGSTDNGAFSDGYEPNNGCGAVYTFPWLGSYASSTYYPTLYGSGDSDYFHYHLHETDSSCQCCDFFCTDEQYQYVVTLTVPAGAGAYEFCTSYGSCGTSPSCASVSAGSWYSWTWNLDGGCGGTDDYDMYVWVYGSSYPGYECTPYELDASFTPGCFF
jgi:hypothetical protein